MYQRYWHLAQSPFDNSFDTAFYSASGTHQGALLKMRYAIENRKGVCLLTGLHGAGKTYLTHVLEQELGDQFAPVVRFVFPQMSPAEMLAYIAIRLGCQDGEVHSRECGVDRILRVLEAQLLEFADRGQRPVIVLDDAHLLQPEHLQTLQLFLNVQQHAGDVCSLVLVGRPDLLPRVQRFGALDSRVAVRMSLHPLTKEETRAYVDHRLEQAGCEGEIFDEEAIQSLWELSQGNPRKLNQLCDLSLLVGYADSLSSVTPIELEAAALELGSVSGD
jgi:type II secretory pathway predicted ATPase ExeA